MSDLLYLLLFIGGIALLITLTIAFLKMQFNAKSLEQAFPDSTLSSNGKRIIKLEDLDPYYVPKKNRKGAPTEAGLLLAQMGPQTELDTPKPKAPAISQQAIPGQPPVMLESPVIDEPATPHLPDTIEADENLSPEQIDQLQGIDSDKMFRHQEIEDFYNNCLSRELTGQYLDLSVLILQLFDDDFEMPSVAKLEQYKESDNEYNESEYNALAKVPLWKHSFNTVEEFIIANKRSATAAGTGSSYPISIVASLAHDIGKLTVFRSKYYVHGEHAATGADIIAQLADSKLKDTQREVLSAAIRTHHYKTNKGLGNIAIKLMEADRHARKKELLGMDLFKVQKVIAHSQEETEEAKYDTSEILVPWFNVLEYLNELKPYINNPGLCRLNNYGVSMRDGNVYFYGKLLYEAFAAIAARRGAPEAELYKGKDEKRRLMIYLVKELQKAGAIADDLIQDGYFCAPFIAQMANLEKGKPVLLTPFKARVFDLNVAKEDTVKEGFFADFVSITPNYGNKPPVQE